MNSKDFRTLCSSGVVCLDGATGTQLILRGMPAGVSPEKWASENPEAISAVQQAYAAAGSRIVYTCTFGGNLPKLREFGLEAQADELNRRLAEISRKSRWILRPAPGMSMISLHPIPRQEFQCGGTAAFNG